MLNNSGGLIEIHPVPSRRMALFGVVVHGVALLAPWLSSLDLFFQSLVSLLVALHFYRFYCRYVMLVSRHSITGLRLHQGQWLLRTSHGWFRVWPSGSQLVTPWLMAFRFRRDPDNPDSPGNYYLCLWSDSDKAGALHALRLRLLLQASEN